MRYFICFLWALGAALSFWLLTQVAIALYIYIHIPETSDRAAAIQGASDYVQAHLAVLRGLDLMSLFLGAVLGATGAWRGKLPGTRHSA